MTRHHIAIGLVAAAVVVGSGVAQAADIPAKAPAAGVAPYSWTGFYAGGNVGYGIADDPTRLAVLGGVLLPSFDVAPHGVVGGVQGGYNWQAGSWVFGIEADIQASGMRSSTNCVLACLVGQSLATTQELPWFGTVRGRIGTAVGGLLFYETIGFAYGEVKTRFTEDLGAGPGTIILNQAKSGWTLGGGVEAALAGNWTARAEYLYVDLGNTSGSYTFTGTAHTFTSDVQQHIFRVGANYRFGPEGAAPAMTAVPRWSGLYAGGNVGHGVANNRAGLFAGAPVGPATEVFDVVPKGILGGAQVGYNWQLANWVLGVEADIQASGQESTQTCALACSALASVAIKQEMPWFGTLRGRVGYSVGPALFYFTGGLAYGEIKNTITETVALVPATFSFNQTKTGFAVGGGIETPMHPIFNWTFPNWTVRTEYLYVDLGSVTDNYTAFTAPHTLTTDVRNHVFRTALNYKFSGL